MAGSVWASLRACRSRSGLVGKGALGPALMALILGVHATYLPFHLLTESHSDTPLRAAASTPAHSQDHDQADPAASDHDAPHSSADHFVQSVPSSGPSYVPLVFLPGASTSVVAGPCLGRTMDSDDKIEVHSQSPPGLLPSRAPPAL